MKRSELNLLIENAIRRVLKENNFNTSLLDNFYSEIGVDVHDRSFNYNNFFSTILDELERLSLEVDEKDYYEKNNIKNVYQEYVESGDEDAFWDTNFEYDDNLESYLSGRWGENIPSSEEFNKLLEEYKQDVNVSMEYRINEINNNLRYLDKKLLELRK